MILKGGRGPGVGRALRRSEAPPGATGPGWLLGLEVGSE